MLGGVGLVVAVIARVLGNPGDVELLVDNIHVSGTATERPFAAVAHADVDA